MGRPSEEMLLLYASCIAFPLSAFIALVMVQYTAGQAEPYRTLRPFRWLSDGWLLYCSTYCKWK